MDVNNEINYANSLINLAMKKTEKKEQRKLLLDAAEIYLKVAKNTEGEQSKYYYSLASEVYLKSQELRETEFNVTEKKSFRPRVTFEDVGGLAKVKEEIRIKIIEPLLHPEVFEYFGKKLGGGILMYGPPGCGKSLIAEATAGEANVAFFNVKSSDIKSKYVGEAEKQVVKLFNDARKEKAAIIFFDEFESLATDRTRMSNNTKGVVSTLLAEMDGVGNKDQNILVIAATNEPWQIDVALRRPGRFDSMIFVPPPDMKARKEIIKINMKNRPVDNIDYEKIAKATEHFSGADIKALCDEATDIPLKEYLLFKKKRKINNADFYEVLRTKTPSILPWFNRARELIERRNEESMFKDVINYAVKLRIAT
ncbi:ATP-binding protein [Candidatus Woesearchaeota archaeon]|nr:MAG: ATP-binding protein [Candidatus Woesearchaeota archaeon]